MNCQNHPLYLNKPANVQRIYRLIDKLNNCGWRELCPTETCWRFTKKGRLCVIRWSCLTTTFSRLDNK